MYIVEVELTKYTYMYRRIYIIVFNRKLEIKMLELVWTYKKTFYSNYPRAPVELNHCI